MGSGMFSIYLKLGFEHISDLNAYDHIIFILALCAIYRLREWRHVLLLVTAFTIGHSVTLALAILDFLRFPAKIIEILIPVTILATSFYNVSLGDSELQRVKSRAKIRLNYGIALLFGLIHGMGFSNFLRASMLPGEEGSLWEQLLAFNIGIEMGQLMIVVFILLLSYLVLNVLKVRQYHWNLFISGAAAGIAMTLLADLL